MKEAVVSPGPKVEIKDVPIPKAKKDQIIIKTIYSGSNPKDWKHAEWDKGTGVGNQGDDIAGIVHEVGENVIEFKKGDRIAAFHEIEAPGGSYAEYSVAWKYTTFLLPEKTSFQEAAAIPLAALTAALALYYRLRLPQPWTPAEEPTPLVVYGGSSAVGVYALQFAKRSNIHPLIAIAGRAGSYVEQFIDRSKGDVILDYRKGPEAVQQGIRDALKGKKLLHAFDAVSQESSLKDVTTVLDPHGAVTCVLPTKNFPFPETMKSSTTFVYELHKDKQDFGLVYSQIITKGLEDGWFKAQQQEVVPGGLAGIEKGLTQLKEGKASAVKYVFKIEDTPGAGQD